MRGFAFRANVAAQSASSQLQCTQSSYPGERTHSQLKLAQRSGKVGTESRFLAVFFNRRHVQGDGFLIVPSLEGFVTLKHVRLIATARMPLSPPASTPPALLLAFSRSPCEPVCARQQQPGHTQSPQKLAAQNLTAYCVSRKVWVQSVDAVSGKPAKGSKAPNRTSDPKCHGTRGRHDCCNDRPVTQT